MRMQKHENWESYHCKTSKTYCTSDRYEKQMHGCCPATCGKCESKSSATNATEDQCKDDDKCLQKNEDWESHVCSTSKKYCERTRYAFEMKCCPKTCGKCPSKAAAKTGLPILRKKNVPCTAHTICEWGFPFFT